MKKFLGYLFMLSVFILVGCANGDTIYEERTIILNIDLKVTPSFAASFGEGEYDESKGIYTHTISYIKDLYI